MIHYYLDPGTGFVFAQGGSFLWPALLGLCGSLVLYFRFFRRHFAFLAVIVLILAGLIMGGTMLFKHAQPGKKVVILAVDALDPRIVERLLASGDLPHLASLRDRGAYSRLKTTVPSETVVAFTTIATGVGPEKHGIFDFVMRDPATYAPYLSLTDIRNRAGRVTVSTRRTAQTLWEYLSSRGKESRVYFYPNTFPPDKIKGVMLSGMGVPDITGTMGRYSFYTGDPLEVDDPQARGKTVRLPDQDRVDTFVFGPRVVRGAAAEEATVPLRIVLDRAARRAGLTLGRRSFLLAEGTWSPWQKVRFRLGPFRHAAGLTRFFLASASPLKLYAAPVQFDPEKPLFPVSHPAGYARETARRNGFYATLGMPHDTWGMSESRLDEQAFLSAADELLSVRAGLCLSELRKQRSGLFVFYFDTLDVLQHLFWRFIDPRHPLHAPGSRYAGVIDDYYRRIDRVVGTVLERCGPDTTVLVLSDHGFGGFRRAVHLNHWLMQKGYLSRVAQPGGRSDAGVIDWQRTRAYAMGFGEIYLNLAGREAQGIVRPAEAPALEEEIMRGLADLRDPADGQPAVGAVYRYREFCSGPLPAEAPDLYVGFRDGYRASWQTALGGVPGGLIEDNARVWSGDHLCDPAAVPGVFFSSRKLSVPDPSVYDVFRTVCADLEVAPPEGVRGRDIFER